MITFCSPFHTVQWGPKFTKLIWRKILYLLQCCRYCNFSVYFSVFNGLHDAAAISASQHEIPPCVRNVIMHQIKSPPKLATENPKKKIKKLSKTITLPEDPYDPTAFTLHFDQYDEYSLMRRQQMKNAKARKSRHTVKVVGSFSFLMTIGIIITVLCFLCEY